MSVNKVILIGHLGKDPEIRYMPSGEAIASVTLATTEKWKDKSGEKQEKTEWHNLTFFGRQAEIAGEYLKKGSQIYVEGRIATEKWQTKEGQDRNTTKIIVQQMQMLGGKSSGGSFEVVENERSEASGSRPNRPAASSSGSAAAPARNAAPSTGSGQAHTTGSAPGRSFDNFDDDIPF